MTEFLVRRFVKDHENISSTEVRTRYGVLSSIVGIVCNALLAAGKLAIGVVMGSIAVMADAFNNLTDAAASVVSFIGVKMADRPANSKHPFGYGRIEYIAAFIVAFLVLQVGFTFLKSSIQKIGEPGGLSFELLPFILLALSVIVKIWLWAFNRKLGKRIDSNVMMATATDSLGDSLTTAVTIISILVFQLTGINVDAWAGIIVSLFVIWAGIGIAKETLQPLIGEPVDPELYKAINDLVRSFDGVEDVHNLIVHDYGPGRGMASIRVEVSKDMDIDQIHGLIDKIERHADAALGIPLVIHVDPVEVRDEYILWVRERVTEIVKGIDERLTIHNFSVKAEESYTDISFDLMVPYEYDQTAQDEVELRTLREINKLEGRYLCVITVIKSFVEM